MSRNCFSRFQSAFILSILAAVVLAFAAGSVQASVYTGLLVDRGLPTFGVNATYPGGGVDWALRSNIGDGDYDSKDPINGSSPAEIPSDDFTLPVGNLGTADPTFQITDIRIWIEGSSTLSFSQEFNSIGLMLGPKNGTLTNLDITPTVTTVSYPNGQSPGSVLWQLDFSVNLTATSGQAFSYAIVPNAKPCPYNTSGNDESYYIAFEEAVMQFAQTGINPSGDGYVGDYYLNGTPADSYTFPAVWGGVQAGDFAIQVFGTHTGTTYTWVNTQQNGAFSWENAGGQNNWNTGAGGAYPNAIDDVATFSGSANPFVDLGGQSITIGTLNLSAGMWNCAAHIFDGTLIFQTSGGSATITDGILYQNWTFGDKIDDIQAAVQLNSNLTINEPTYNGTSGVNTWNQAYPAAGVVYGGLKISGAISGSGGITKTGPELAWISNAANSFTGGITIQDGYLEFATGTATGTGWGQSFQWTATNSGLLAMGSPTNVVTLGGLGTIGHLVVADSGAGDVMSNPVVLTGEGGAFHCDSWGPFQTSSVISGSGNLFLTDGTWVQFNNTADNTYVGDTYISSYAKVNTGVTNRVFNGNVTVEGYGQLQLVNPNNVDSTKTVTLGSFVMGSPSASILATLFVTNDFMPNINPNSSGVFDINGTSGAAINAALAVGAPQLGNGYMYIGSSGAAEYSNGTFTGTSLQPDLDNVYRFFVSSAQNAGLTLSSAPLQDVNGHSESVEVSSNITWGMTGIAVVGSNNFSGSLTVDPATYYLGYNGSFGSNAALGAVNLNGGELLMYSYGKYAQNTKGTLTLEGQTAIGANTMNAFGNNSNLALISFTSIVRENNAIFFLDAGASGAQDAVLGLNFQVTDTTAGDPAATNYNNGTMAAPWIVQRSCIAVNTWQSGFTVYNATNGFEAATFTATNGFGADNGTDIVNLTSSGDLGGGSHDVWALRTTQALTDGTINIQSGGLILDAGSSNRTNSANINFGPAEGVIFGIDNGFNEYSDTFTGTISGSGGLTFGASYSGNPPSHIFVIQSNNSNTLTGTITINQGVVEIADWYSLGASTNTIVLNGGAGGDTNSVVGGLTGYNSNNITLANPIVLGPNGGSFFVSPYGLADFTLNGPISGPGTFYMSGHPAGFIYITNGANNWTGGTEINSGQLIVTSTGMFGTGPVMIGGGDGAALILQGNNNIDPNTRVGIWHGASFLDSDLLELETSAVTIGSLEGNGRVYFNYGGASTLTMGQNGLSTDFYGNISDQANCPGAGSGTGSLIKTGTGTFTFWGETFLSGTVNVNGGTFADNGKINGPGGVTVNTGGTLTGTGLITPAVTVAAGGTVTGSLTMNNGLTLSGVNATTNLNGATINGTLWANSSGAAGMTNSTVNGAVNIGPTGGAAYFGTFTGNGNTINGNLQVIAGATGGTGSTFSGSGNTINGMLTVGKPTAGRAPCTFSGSNTVNSPSANTILQLGTISGSNIFNTQGMYVNYSNVGLCTLTGSNTINGPTLLDSNGSSNYLGSTNAVVSGSNTFNGSVTIYGGTFEGPNTVNGSLTTVAASSAIVAPSADSVSAHTLTVVGAVTLDHSTALDFNLGTPGTPGGGINDLIDITGSLSLDGTLNVNGLTGFNTGTYTLFTYTGALSGAGLTLGTMPSGMGYTYSIDTSTFGQVNLDVVLPWQPGDTNRDGLLNSLDIDAIYHNFGAPATSQWKVDGDGNVVGQGDVTYELHTYFHTNYGDANLDTKTDFSDFQVLLDHWQVSGPTIGWAQGDFNGSYSVDFLDFQTLLDYWNPGGWSFAPAQTPEPTTLALMALGGLAILRRKKN